MKIKICFVLILCSVFFMIACASSKSIETSAESTNVITNQDSLGYQKGLEHAVEEKLLPEYKSNLKSKK